MSPAPHRRFGRFIPSRRRGSTSIEYALALAAILGGIIAAVSVVGPRVSRIFETAMVAGGAHPAANAATSSSSAAPRATEPANNEIDLPGVLVFAGQTVMLFVCVGYMVYSKRRRDRQQAEENAVAEPIFTEDKGRRVFAKRQQILKVLSGNMEALLASQVLVRHLMSDRLTTVTTAMTADEVREMMDENQLRHLLVVGNQGELVGIISDRDLRKSEARTAAQLMTANPHSVEAESLISPAITQMMKRRISALPVTAEGRLVGVLTTTDLMMTLQCCLQVLESVAGQLRGSQEQEHEAESYATSA